MEADQDIYLDAIALLAARQRDSKEEFFAVLDATGRCPWYLERLVGALADLGIRVLGDLPEDEIDRVLASLRQGVLAWP